MYNQNNIKASCNSNFITTPKQHKQLLIISKENIDPADNTPFFAKCRPPLVDKIHAVNSQPRQNHHKRLQTQNTMPDAAPPMEDLGAMNASESNQYGRPKSISGDKDESKT